MKKSDALALALTKAAIANPFALPDYLAKAWVQSGTATTGLTAYDLRAPALELVPVNTPFVNKTPRVSGGTGIQANWKAVTALNTAHLSIGMGEGRRAGNTSSTVVDYFAAFRGLGLEDSVTFEARYAGVGFEDLLSTASLRLLKAFKIAEEDVILGGNTSMPLGQAAQPTLSASANGGTLAAATWSVIVVALTMDGLRAASLAAGVPGQRGRTNGDGSTDTYGGGSSKPSAAATVATTGATGAIAATTATIPGAFGYAWFWGPVGAEVLGAITTINSVTITAAATGTQPITALQVGGAYQDNSTNGLVYDGHLTQILKNGAGYAYTMPTGTAGQGTPLTADGEGGIVEIDNALQWFWDNYRLQPDAIWVSSQERKNITRKVLGGNNLGAQRFMINSNQGAIMGGDLVASYLAKFDMNGGKAIPVRLHPTMPPGTIMFDTDELPYPASGVTNVSQILCRQDYYTIPWPQITRRNDMGVYYDGVLQNFFPPAFGLITNIANG